MSGVWSEGWAVASAPARAAALEALSIADRAEYRLAQAEIHNFLARLALDSGAAKLVAGDKARRA